MRIEYTRNEELIYGCMTHPKIWPHVSCDGVSKGSVKLSDNWLFLAPVDDDLGVLGVFAIEPHNPVWVEVHTMLLPLAWGTPAKDAAKALLDFLADKGFRKLTTLVPSDNPAALRYAKAAGLKVEGVIKASFPRNGELLDQTLLGVELCQQQPQPQP